jgi:isochorismate hydrolase
MVRTYASVGNIRKKGRQWLGLLDEYDRGDYGFRLDPPRSALIVIDMQDYFLDEGSHAFIPESKAILPNVKALIDSYRKNGLQVVFTRHAHDDNEDHGMLGKWWADVIMDGHPSSRITSELEPMESEPVIRKNRYSAFQGTDLDAFLRARGIRSVVITGVMTHLCCETTAREAFMKDFEVYFVVDGTATQSEDLHISSLKTLAHGFAVPVTTDDVLGILEESSDE